MMCTVRLAALDEACNVVAYFDLGSDGVAELYDRSGEVTP